MNAREERFLDIIAAENLRLDLSALEYVAHWVTPVGPPRRFDTRFFVALAPAAQTAAHDAGETVAETWVRPASALAAARRGDLEMIFPTIKNLELIAALDDTTAVMAWARARRHIARIEPRLVTRDGGVVVLMPGDDGYDG